MPKVSIILPFHNTGEYILDTLQDIKNQTAADFECLLIDNSSTDNSRELCERFITGDSRFKILTEPTPGPAASRNTGLATATGDYIYFCDSDDRLHPQLLEIASTFICDAEILQFEFKRFADKEKISFEKINSALSTREIKHPLDQFIESNPACVLWRNLFKRKILQNMTFDIRFKRSEDRLFIYTLLHKYTDLKIVSLDACLYYYRKRPGSITQTQFTCNDLFQSALFMREQTKMFADMPQRLKKLRKAQFVFLTKDLYRNIQASTSEVQTEGRRVIYDLLCNSIIHYTDFSFRWMLRLFLFAYLKR